MKRTRNKSRFPKDQDAEIGHVGYEWIDDDEVALSVDAAEAVNMRYFTSRTLCKPKANQPYMMPPNAKKKKEVTNQERVYTFDITQQEAIFDHLNADGRIKFRKGYKPPSPPEMAGKEYCKYHCSWTHSTNECIVFRNMIQAALDKGDMRIDDATQVETHPFPLEQPINMVNLHPVSHHSGGTAGKDSWKSCSECSQLADRVLSQIHWEEHENRRAGSLAPKKEVTVMIDGEPQIWVRREMPEADSKLKEASELILQAVRGEQRQNVKARLIFFQLLV